MDPSYHGGRLLGRLWWWQPDGRLRVRRSERCGDEQQSVLARHSTTIDGTVQHATVQRLVGADVLGSLRRWCAVGGVRM